MKKIILTTVVMAVLLSTSAFAGSCEIPKFLKEGATIFTAAGMSAEIVKVLEIDKKACWIKVHDKDNNIYWENLNTIEKIEPEGKKIRRTF